MALDVGRVQATVADRFQHASRVPAAASAPLSGTQPATYLIWAGIFGAIVGFNELALEQLRAGHAHYLGSENGPLEGIQHLVLVSSLALFSLAAWRGRGAVRIAGALLALVGTVALVREIEFKSWNGSLAWLDWLVAHGLQDGLLALFGLAAVLYLFVQRRYFWGLVRLGTRWQAWPCVLSAVLLATAELYLDGFSEVTGYFWEELVETNGYFLFAIAAWRHLGLIGDCELCRPL